LGKSLTNPFFGRDVISIREFSKHDFEYLFKTADQIYNRSFDERKGLAAGRLIGLMFFEPSTRTRLSFEAAMLSIGGQTVSITETRTTSVEKGENLHDTVKTVESYVDLIVLRHRMEGAARFAAQIAKKPIINGGSGSEEHPTQAMLDVYTILKERGSVSNLKIAVVGDLKYGRTVYSLLYGLANFNPCIYLISPPELRLREEVLAELDDQAKVSQHKEIEEVIDELDVIYMTRIQKERFPDLIEYEKVKGSYIIDNQLLMKGREDLMVMHPLPRTTEIRPEVDSTPHAKYFQQIHYGKTVRAALISLILNRDL
jgi:aspartate carbamoyltransferase catalytic subunit